MERMKNICTKNLKNASILVINNTLNCIIFNKLYFVLVLIKLGEVLVMSKIGLLIIEENLLKCFSKSNFYSIF